MAKKRAGCVNMTYAKQAKENCLSVTLQDLGISNTANYGINKVWAFHKKAADLVTFTPTKQSHLGRKFDDYSKLNTRSTEEFLTKLFKSLGTSNVNLFKTYKPGKSMKNDLYQCVTNSKDAMILVRCDNGVKESIYMGVRNAIAHGNIIHDGKYYVLYSVSDDKKEFDSEVTFFLRIDKLSKLGVFRRVLESYL